MGKRLVFLITALLIGGIVAGWYFFAKESRDFGNSPIKAVPMDAPYFVKIRNLGDFAEKTVKNSGWRTVRNLKGVSTLYDDLVSLDSILQQNKEYTDFFRKKELIVVPFKKSKLYLLNIESIAEKSSVQNLIKNYFVSKNIQATTENYENCLIQQYEWLEASEKRGIRIAYCKGILMISDELDLLKKALSQMDHPSVLDNPDYLKINKNSTQNTDLNIFINHHTLPAFLSVYFTDSLKCNLLQDNYASWTELDVIQKESQWLINGFTVSDSLWTGYLDIFKRQKPLGSTLVDLMPSVTSFFVIQNLSDQSSYFEDCNRYLQKRGELTSFNKLVSDLSKALRINIRQYLSDHWSGEAAIIFTNPNLEDTDDDRFLLMKVKLDKNDPLFSSIVKWSAGTLAKKDEEQIDAAKNNIWKVPIDNFGQIIGGLCFGSVKTRWMTIGDGFILMGSTPGSLKRYRNLLQNNELLKDNQSYQKHISEQAKTATFTMWSSPGQVLPFLGQVFHPEIFQLFKEEHRELFQVENFFWQWGYENDFVFNSANISVCQVERPMLQAPFWRYQIESNGSEKAFFVSFSTKSDVKDLILMDVNNILTDLDKDGSARWKVRLDGAIKGRIKVIDFYGNGESQLLFNTLGAIHLIDRNGQELRNFPIKLNAEATNEVAVFDYDGKRDYRYLVACEDHRIYNFDKNGKATAGWQSIQTKGVAEFPIQHFRIGSKDFLLYVDKSQTFILDRQGKERVKIKEKFVPSQNNLDLIVDSKGNHCLATTDVHGKIKLIGFDGSVQKIDCGTYSSEHYSLPVDFSEDGKFNFLFFDKKILSMYDLSGKKVFSLMVTPVIDQFPGVVQMGGEKMIQLNSVKENRTILVRKDGSIFDRFPPDKHLVKAIGTFGVTGTLFNGIAASSDGFLLNYQLVVK